MPHLPIGANEIYYEVYGDSANESLLLIPGLSLDGRYWQYQIEALSGKFQVIVFDPRDTGRTKSSSSSSSYSINDLADDAAQLLTKLGIAQAHVLGYSMGAMVAQSLASHHKQLVSSLILVSAGDHKSHKNKAIISSWLALSKNLPIEIALKEVMLWVHGDRFLNSEAALNTKIAEILKAPFPQSLTQYERQVQALLDPGLHIDLTAIKAPTLVICGTQDRLFSAAEMQHIAHNISNGSIQYVEAGHELLQEEPDEANVMIIDFCSRNVASTIK